MKRYTVLVGFKNPNELSDFLAKIIDITPSSYVDSTCVIYSFRHPDAAFEFVSLITLIGYNYNTLCCNTFTL